MKIVLPFLLLACTFGFSQNDTLLTSLGMHKFDDESSFKPFVWKSSFANNKFSFSSYNAITGINNRYTKMGDNYFLSNTKTFSTINILDLNRIDSYNPYGTTNFGAAIIMGTLNLILKNDKY